MVERLRDLDAGAGDGDGRVGGEELEILPRAAVPHACDGQGGVVVRLTDDRRGRCGGEGLQPEVADLVLVHVEWRGETRHLSLLENLSGPTERRAEGQRPAVDVNVGPVALHLGPGGVL